MSENVGIGTSLGNRRKVAGSNREIEEKVIKEEFRV